MHDHLSHGPKQREGLAHRDLRRSGRDSPDEELRAPFGSAPKLEGRCRSAATVLGDAAKGLHAVRLLLLLLLRRRRRRRRRRR
jgi:hypothetical protein